MTHMFPFTLTISLQTVVIISRLPDGVTDVSIFSVRPELASWIYFIDFIFLIRRLTRRFSQRLRGSSPACGGGSAFFVRLHIERALVVGCFLFSHADCVIVDAAMRDEHHFDYLEAVFLAHAVCVPSER